MTPRLFQGSAGIGRRAGPPAAVLWLVVCLTALAAAPVLAEFYRYQDENGQTVFVDDMGKVPPEHRQDVKSYSEAASDPQPPAPAAEPSEPPQPDAAPLAETPVKIRRNRVYVPATLGYGVVKIDAVLVLDTGATHTALFRDAAKRLFMRGLDRAIGRTASGGAVQVELATLDFIQVGPHRRERHRVGIVDAEGPSREYDGLLGMDFLAGLDFDIDFQRKVLVWR